MFTSSNRNQWKDKHLYMTAILPWQQHQDNAGVGGLQLLRVRVET